MTVQTWSDPQCVLLENVNAFNFVYGIDYDGAGNEDGSVDYWETDSTKIGNQKGRCSALSIDRKTGFGQPGYSKGGFSKNLGIHSHLEKPVLPALTPNPL